MPSILVASGSFGIYAVQGAAFTQWTDSNFTPQFFTNVPDGTDTVRNVVNANVKLNH